MSKIILSPTRYLSKGISREDNKSFSCGFWQKGVRLEAENYWYSKALFLDIYL